MDEKLVQVLLELKVRYFASSYFSIANWIMFNRIKLPDGLLQEDMQEWANEKQLYLAASKVNLDGIKSNYEQTIIDRLDSGEAKTSIAKSLGISRETLYQYLRKRDERLDSTQKESA